MLWVLKSPEGLLRVFFFVMVALFCTRDLTGILVLLLAESFVVCGKSRRVPSPEMAMYACTYCSTPSNVLWPTLAGVRWKICELYYYGIIL